MAATSSQDDINMPMSDLQKHGPSDGSDDELKAEAELDASGEALEKPVIQKDVTQ